MTTEDLLLSQEALFANNPLLGGLKGVQVRIARFKEQVKEYHFRVLLSQHECPECGAELAMIGASQCACACGKVLDPRLAFQQRSVNFFVVIGRPHFYFRRLLKIGYPKGTWPGLWLRSLSDSTFAL